MKDKFYESVAGLLSPRSIITLLVFGSACWLSIRQQPITPLLEKGCYGLFTVWFGEKFWGFIKELKNGQPK